ncbi:uncharacterized protein [Phaseolus vulgaris]|uniref:uncharacterized protein n=1 Tax=Phaseolus vulgaris TaxID=3885 RepID=UPI0035CAE7BD
MAFRPRMPPITFTNEDFKGVDYRQQDDPIVIAVDIDRFTIRKTLVDQGSSVDIVYWKTFKAMKIAETEMMPYDDHVVGFSSERVGTKGYIELYTTFDEGKNTRTIKIRYVVIDANTSYNILLGQPSINRLMAIVSTPHLTMKFPSRTGDILTVHVDQKEARECYAESLRVEPLRNDTSPLRVRKSSRKDYSPRKDWSRTVEPTVALVDLDPRAAKDRLEAREELWRVPLLDEEHNTAVGTAMAAVEAEIMHVGLKKNMDMFAWTPADMPGISMHPRNKEKTTFMTAETNYYYEVMPFGLKNAGVTYQRLMDKIFKGLIGRAVEVYVDDIVIKSDSFEQHLKDLNKVFRALKGVNMKLNPKRCTFRVEGGKFLGFMLTHRGIETNPDKCQAILGMRSPNSIKEIQQLLGRLTALSRFVPRLAERTRPMVQLLQKGTKFVWDDRCEEIFKQLKEFLTSPTVIQKPRPDHPILVYLVVSEEAVNAALVQESEGKEWPVYFVSRTLHSVEM